MSVAEVRPSVWSPQVIALSIAFHAALIYFVAVAFQIVPSPLPDIEPISIPTVRFDPPPPRPIDEDIPIERPIIQPKDMLRPPVPTPVPPLPIPSVPVPMTSGSPVLVLNRPISERPISNSSIRYPRTAELQDVEGRVRLSITILPDGSVTDVQIVGVNPRGYGFEDAAAQSVRTWRYKASGRLRRNVYVDIDFVLT